jgi:hypothetical protein
MKQNFTVKRGALDGVEAFVTPSCALSSFFDASTRGAAQTDRLSLGLLGNVSHQGVGGERRAPDQSSALGQGAKAILRWQTGEPSPMSMVIRYNQNNKVHQ